MQKLGPTNRSSQKIPARWENLSEHNIYFSLSSTKTWQYVGLTLLNDQKHKKDTIQTYSSVAPGNLKFQSSLRQMVWKWCRRVIASQIIWWSKNTGWNQGFLDAFREKMWGHGIRDSWNPWGENVGPWNWHTAQNQEGLFQPLQPKRQWGKNSLLGPCLVASKELHSWPNHRTWQGMPGTLLISLLALAQGRVSALGGFACAKSGQQGMWVWFSLHCRGLGSWPALPAQCCPYQGWSSPLGCSNSTARAKLGAQSSACLCSIFLPISILNAHNADVEQLVKIQHEEAKGAFWVVFFLLRKESPWAFA